MREGEHKKGVRLVYDDPLAITRRVTDERGRPLAGVKIGSPRNPDTPEITRTDANGFYAAMYLDENERELAAEQDGYQTATLRVSPGDRDVDFVLSPTRAVELAGRIVCGDTGETVRRFEINVFRRAEVERWQVTCHQQSWWLEEIPAERGLCTNGLDVRIR